MTNSAHCWPCKCISAPSSAHKPELVAGNAGFAKRYMLVAGSAGFAKRYMPFAEGARDCLGQNLAKTSLIATIATLLSHLHFDLAERV